MKASVRTAAAAVAVLFALAALTWWVLQDDPATRGETGRANSYPAAATSGTDARGTPGDRPGGVRTPRRRVDVGSGAADDPGRASNPGNTAAPSPESESDSTDGGNQTGPGSGVAGAGRTDRAGSSPQPQHENLPEGPAGIGEVVGRVLLFPDRTPMEGVVVRVTGGGPGRDVAPFPKPGRCTTGPNGIFRIAGFAPGTYGFEAAAEDRAARTFRVAVPAHEPPDEVEVLFGAGGSVEGRVFTSAGAAVGVKVRINPSGIGGGRGLLATETDAAGGYRFLDLAPGNYGVEVDGDGVFDGRNGSVTVTAGETAQLDFLSESSLTGVLTVDGEPFDGGIVRAVWNGRPYRSQQATSGKNGAFEVSGLEPGEYRIGVQLVTTPGFALDVDVTTIRAGQNRLDIALGRGDLGGAISGQLVAEATGAPVSARTQMTIHAMTQESEDAWAMGSQIGMAFPDGSGAFRILGLRAGRYHFIVRPQGGGLQTTRLDVTLAWGERKSGLEIRLPAREPAETPEETASASVLSGSVTDGGRPVSGAFVRAQSTSSASSHSQTRTDGTGRYLLDQLEPGTWWVTVQVVGTGGFSAEVAEAVIKEGKNGLDIRIGEGELAGQIRGLVTERVSRDPLSSQDVVLWLWTRGADGAARNVGMSTPDKEGSFRFRCVRGGAYRVLAYPRGASLQKQEVDVDVRSGQDVEGVAIALEEMPTGEVRFVLRDEDGQPVGRATIHSLLDGEFRQGSTTANSSSGVYVTHFEAGLHEFTIRNWEGSITAELTLDVREGETTEVEVVLRPKAE